MVASSLIIKDTLREYAQGSAQQNLQPVANFLAPGVEVSRPTGYFKRYSDKHRFRIPDTRRSFGGPAAILNFEATDASYNCTPNGLDCALDYDETGDQFDQDFKDASDSVSEVASLAHEKKVIDLAIANAGSATGLTWTGATPTDPIADLDAKIKAVMLAAKCGSSMGIGVIFGVDAWLAFKNADKVRGKFIIGNTSKSGAAFAIPTEDMIGQLILGNPETMVSYMCYDNAAEGMDADVKFILSNQILIFARQANPTRRDPSFMKTFRLRGRWMVPGLYERQDKRGQVVKMDWSEDVQVTNTAAVKLLTIS